MRGAVLFDMDGTLVDSEGQTDAAVAAVMARFGHAGASLPPSQTRGRTWGDIARALRARYGALDVDDDALGGALVDAWSADVDGMAPIPGAADAVRAAAAVAPVAVVSSSPRALVERLLDKLGVRDAVSVVVGAEDVAHPKPAPDCFRAGLDRLARAAASAGAGSEGDALSAGACVVFEDSSAGLEAARAAGMRTRLVLHRCAEPDVCLGLADDAFAHYAALPAGFWRELMS